MGWASTSIGSSFSSSGDMVSSDWTGKHRRELSQARHSQWASSLAFAWSTCVSR